MCVFFVIYVEYFPYCLFVSYSQVIGCEDRLRNDLYCVRWGVKLYSTQLNGSNRFLCIWDAVDFCAFGGYRCLILHDIHMLKKLTRPTHLLPEERMITNYFFHVTKPTGLS